MIASLRGRILRLDLGSVVLETNSGVGYEIIISFPTHLHLKETTKDKEVILYIFHSITDRNQKLFGFLTNRDRELFQVMKSFNGIGELTALKILSFYNADGLYKIATEENRLALEKIPKVKGKTSEKVLFELKQNLKKIESFLSKDDQIEGTIDSIPNRPEDSALDLAILGLIQLGFDEKSSKREVDRLWKMGIHEPSEIIREILKNL
jgi:Holliday junction DNA helicase RuvA